MNDPLQRWDFHLPDDRIARHPAEKRDGARLLHVPRDDDGLMDQAVIDLPDLLREGDLLVANDTRVMEARVPAVRASGGRVEVLFLGPGPGPVEAMVRPLRRIKDGEWLLVPGAGRIQVRKRTDLAAHGLVEVVAEPDPLELMRAAGELPLPPYLGRRAEEADRERYQTVFAGPVGASAAPTAGLHLTEDVLSRCRDRGVGFCTVTLHVGLGTFRPLRPEDIAAGELHAETYRVTPEVAEAVRETRARGGRVIAVGTTTARTLESASDAEGRVSACSGSTRLFMKPPYTPRSFDGLLTNFHLPKSSLLMLVACLCGRDRLFSAYRHAVSHGYRFYSYGDAMLLL
ncbi:MAG: tRNA preQ1(34) S-adenosylmethionine ribosyltransferase-isomerase QueA [Myxococcota bacterium]